MCPCVVHGTSSNSRQSSEFVSCVQVHHVLVSLLCCTVSIQRLALLSFTCTHFPTFTLFLVHVCFVSPLSSSFSSSPIQCQSLPVVVIVHVTQQPAAEATIFWDNAFAEAVRYLLFLCLLSPCYSFISLLLFTLYTCIQNREQFVVPEVVPWPKVADALGYYFLAHTGRGLTHQNLDYLGRKLLGVGGYACYSRCGLCVWWVVKSVTIAIVVQNMNQYISRVLSEYVHVICLHAVTQGVHVHCMCTCDLFVKKVPTVYPANNTICQWATLVNL